jgi:hypothetical protein
MFEGPGENLPMEGDRNHDHLVVIIFFELWHVVTFPLSEKVRRFYQNSGRT